jgi:hypothetical protein
MARYFNKLVLIFTAAVSIMYSGCTEVPESVISNLEPETHLSLTPDSIISPQKTRIKISWWGDDPDGLVKGYRISFDSLNWSFTSNNDSTFLFVIIGNDSTFRIWVAAVDNEDAIDKTPATNLIPVYNSPPEVTFNPGTEIPDTSFIVATFSWSGTDPDGNNTIKYYYWSLNDTTTWERINGNINIITLRQTHGIIPNANNILYLKAEDVAGTQSNIKRMPDTNKTWYVRQPVGRFLIIDDYAATILDNRIAEDFYRNSLTGKLYSSLDIKVSGGANIPKIQNPMFIETMKLFEAVIWYAGRGNGLNDNANFDLAQQTLPYYTAAGGKLFFTTGFPNSIDAQGNIANFAPIDSATQFQVVTMTSQIPVIVVNQNYDTLTTGSPAPDRVRGVYPRLGANIIYKMPFQTTYPPYENINVCVKDAANNPKVIFMSVPLHRMNGSQNADDFLRQILEVDFGIN